MEEILEKIGYGAKEETLKEDQSKFRPPNEHAIYGRCGYSAKNIVKKLIEMDVSKELISVYSLDRGYHYFVGVGKSWNESILIDPLIDANESSDKILFTNETHPLLIIKHPDGTIRKFKAQKTHEKYFFSS